MSKRYGPEKSSIGVPELHCACATVRRASRLITQMYSDHLGVAEIEAAQMALLMAVQARPGITAVMLGKTMALDKTTLSRNLKLLQKRD